MPQTTIDSAATADQVRGAITRGLRKPRRVRVLPLLMGATLLFYALFYIWPVLTVAIRSFNETGKLSLGSFSLGNYTDLFQDDFLLGIEMRTIRLALLSTLITVLLAFPTAFILSRLNRKVGNILLLMVLVPFWISIVVRLFSVSSIVSPSGPIAWAMRSLGMDPPDMLYTEFSTLIGTVMYLLPYMIMVLYSGMAGIDGNLLLASKTMGASPWKTFTTVYLPSIKSSLISGTLLIFILGLGFFLVPAVLGGPDQQTIAVFIQQQIDIYKWGAASAMGVLLLVVTLICYAGVLRLSGTSALTGVGGAQSKGVSNQLPFKWTPLTVACAVLAAVVVAILLIPVLFIFPLSVGETGTVVFPPRGFTLHWYAEVFTSGTWTGPLLKSLIVALGTAVLSVTVAIIASLFVARTTSTFMKVLVSGLCFAPLITPGILLAIGMFDVQLRFGLANTTIGLILAHTVVASPFAFAVISTAMASQDPSLEQAAWTMGASRFKSFTSVLLRGMMPAIIAGFGIAFATSWDEVVLALFLQSGPDKTLPVTIYKYMESGIVPSVPAVSALLVLVIVFVVLIPRVLRRRNRTEAA